MKERPYHHGDLRTALLRAAERTLRAGDTGELSLRELSRQVGVSSTAPRRHFANKHALLDALAIDGFKRLGAALAEAGRDTGVPFDIEILRLAQAHVRFALRHQALLRLMFSAKAHRNASAELQQASTLALSAGPKAILRGQAAGLVVQGDPDRLSLTIFATVEGLLALSINEQVHGQPLDRMMVEVVGQVILGLRPRARTDQQDEAESFQLKAEEHHA